MPVNVTLFEICICDMYNSSLRDKVMVHETEISNNGRSCRNFGGQA